MMNFSSLFYTCVRRSPAPQLLVVHSGTLVYGIKWDTYGVKWDNGKRRTNTCFSDFQNIKYLQNYFFLIISLSVLLN